MNRFVWLSRMLPLVLAALLLPGAAHGFGPPNPALSGVPQTPQERQQRREMIQRQLQEEQKQLEAYRKQLTEPQKKRHSIPDRETSPTSPSTAPAPRYGEILIHQEP